MKGSALGERTRITMPHRALWKSLRTKVLVALLSTVSVCMAQFPPPIDPEAFPSSRSDFEQAVEAYHGMLKMFSALSEFTKSSPPPDVERNILDPASIPDTDPSKPRPFDFRKEKLDQIIRNLARQAKINVVVESGLDRPITFYMENKSPREMIEILCISERLAMDEFRGVFYIKRPGTFHARRTESIAESTREIFDAYLSNGFTKAETTELIVRFPEGFAQGLDEAQASRKGTANSPNESKIARTPLVQSNKPPRKTTRKNSLSSNTTERRTIHEFSGDDVAFVLRKLGREANMDIFVRDDVQGSITLRLENKTAREIIDTIAYANGHVMDEVNGVYFVRSAASDRNEAAQRVVRPAKLMFDAYRAKGFTRDEALQLMLRLPAGASLRFVYPDLPPGMQSR